MKTGRKSSAASALLVIISILLLMVTSLFPGCSTVSNATKKITGGSGSKQKKTVAIAVFENRTFFDTPTFQRVYHQELSTRLAKECSENLYIKLSDAAYPDSISKLPRLKSGDIDAFTLAKLGRKLGINFIVTGKFVSIKTSEKMKGLIWFKETHPMAKLNVSTAVYDVETGALLFDERFEREVEVDENLQESIRKKEAKNPIVIIEALKQLAEPISEKMCDEISDQPWKGFITAITDNKVILSSGKEAGIKPGDVLQVFANEDTIEGINDQKFFLPGLKTGEIKITATFPGRSEAVIISGENIRVDSTVKPR
jgi:hypothetical protein